MNFTYYQNELLYFIRRFINDNGFAPNALQLATLIRSSSEEVEQNLLELEQQGALSLNPNSFDIWIAPPYTLYPSAFLIKTEEKIWWANCAWCSFGIAVLTGNNAQIFFRSGKAPKLLKLSISGSSIYPTNYVVHIPMDSQFWEGRVSCCTDVLIFETEREVSVWCKRFNKPKGQIISIEKLWLTSRQWFHDYFERGFGANNPNKIELVMELSGQNHRL